MSSFTRIRLRASLSEQRACVPRKIKEGLLEVWSETASGTPIPSTISYVLSSARSDSLLGPDEVVETQSQLFEYWSRISKKNKPIIYGDGLTNFSSPHLEFFRLSHINENAKNGLSALSHHCRGVTTPLFYLGTGGSVFGIHTEDCDLCAISQLLGGAPKFWVIISPDHYEQALQMLSEVLSESYEVTRHKSYFIAVRYLESYGIPYTIYRQEPGDTLVLLPRALHFGWNAGDNLAQSTNFWPGTLASFKDFQTTVRRCLCGCPSLFLSAAEDELISMAYENNAWVEVKTK